MTTILVTLTLGFLISVFITPLAGRVGGKIGAIDLPGERKIHHVPIPRSGGIAIFLSFCAALAMSKLLMTQISEQLVLDTKTVMFFAGACVIFGVGLIDDIYRLNHKIKFLAQIVSASIAFFGGMRVVGIFYVELGAQSVIVSYCLTVFWFVLVINAVNLIDGLDGLAAGICFFTSTILTFFLFGKGMYLMAMLFSALAGSTLGFLRYNFNPASIFMGDSGSYFLGYSIAALSIMGGIKSQTGLIMLIPLLAMGIPVFDTILSPIRRFLLGKKMFQPDKKHIHHQLLISGLSSKNAVLLIYACSLVLCFIALVLANIYDRRAGIFLVVLAVISVVFLRKLGYFEYLASDKIYGWLQDITDVTGLSHSRRSFLSLQMEISKSKTLEEMWENICFALKILKFDRVDLYLNGLDMSKEVTIALSDMDEQRRHANRGRQSAKTETATWYKKGDNSRLPDVLCWARGDYKRKEDISRDGLLKIELPLLNGLDSNVKTLVLIKDLKIEQISKLTLRRVEQLRETIMRTLDWLERESVAKAKIAELGPDNGIKGRKQKTIENAKQNTTKDLP